MVMNSIKESQEAMSTEMKQLSDLSDTVVPEGVHVFILVARPDGEGGAHAETFFRGNMVGIKELLLDIGSSDFH